MAKLHRPVGMDKLSSSVHWLVEGHRSKHTYVEATYVQNTGLKMEISGPRWKEIWHWQMPNHEEFGFHVGPFIRLLDVNFQFQLQCKMVVCKVKNLWFWWSRKEKYLTPQKEGPTLKPISFRLGTCQGQKNLSRPTDSISKLALVASPSTSFKSSRGS